MISMEKIEGIIFLSSLVLGRRYGGGGGSMLNREKQIIGATEAVKESRGC